jgi:hypothetical protein
MPFSNTEQMSPIMAEIVNLNPRSILDVGCGLGVYGMLCRIHLDLYHDLEFYKKLEGFHPWSTRIEGIEGCKAYTPFIPPWAYDKIHTGNALDVVPTMPDSGYDLILILAMIEHLSREEGMDLIDHLKRIGKAIILSVPKNWQEQEISGYPLETHRSHWTEQDLREAGFNRFLPHWGAWLAVYGIPPDHEPDTDSTTQTSDSFILLNNRLNKVCADISSFESQITTLNENSGHIRRDIATLLLNQQIIFDRLSISSRLRSLKKRLGRVFLR